MKIDVAVQSYMKPESLLYTLMTLREHSEDLIDTVFINDDCSAGDVADKYKSGSVSDYFKNWRIRVRVNTHRTGWGPGYVLGYWPRYLTPGGFVRYGTRNLYRYRRLFYARENIRYQWALEQTDKKYLFVIHDDVEFRGDTVRKYLDCIDRLARPAIVGDLGQCWRCPYAKEPQHCTPFKITGGFRPSVTWPVTGLWENKKNRACRINEWTSLLSVQAANDILEKERVFFGNYDDFGDVGAYWFERAIALGYGFSDPLPDPLKRLDYYVHGWQGHSGHSVWVDQGGGRKQYNKEMVLGRMREKYGLTLP